MEWLKSIGLAGFLFFFIKGMLWLVLFALVYFDLVKKETMARIKSKLSLRRKKKT